LNTADIRDFCIVGMKTAGSGVLSLKAVTGSCATLACQKGHHMAHSVAALHAEVEDFISSEISAHQVSDFYDVNSGIYYETFICSWFVICSFKIILTFIALFEV
jgi:alanyl-tRNA synthetase